MKEPSDPVEVAKLLKELWPDAKRIEFHEGEYREGEYREGLSFYIDCVGSEDFTLPAELPYTNPKWSDETKAALLWVLRYHKTPGASWPVIAKGIGMEQRHFRRYFKPNPPDIQDDTINKIWDFKKRVEP